MAEAPTQGRWPSAAIRFRPDARHVARSLWRIATGYPTPEIDGGQMRSKHGSAAFRRLNLNMKLLQKAMRKVQGYASPRGLAAALFALVATLIPTAAFAEGENVQLHFS